MQNKKIETTNSTQDVIEIADVKDDMLILRDGSVRSVIMVSSINFALKNQDEQESIVNSYNSFLNSLSYPVQIVIQSRNLDIDDYIEKLRQISKQQTNELLRVQTLDYIQFIEELLVGESIMSKKFFIVIPYSSVENVKKNFFDKFTKLISPSSVVQLKKKHLEDYKNQLLRRVGHVQSGLESMGLQSVVLDTGGLIELFYNCYNPELSKRQKLRDMEKIKIDEE